MCDTKGRLFRKILYKSCMLLLKSCHQVKYVQLWFASKNGCWINQWSGEGEDTKRIHFSFDNLMGVNTREHKVVDNDGEFSGYGIDWILPVCWIKILADVCPWWWLSVCCYSGCCIIFDSSLITKCIIWLQVVVVVTSDWLQLPLYPKQPGTLVSRLLTNRMQIWFQAVGRGQWLGRLHQLVQWIGWWLFQRYRHN